MEYIQDLGRIALGSRLKKFSSELFRTTNNLYKEMGIEMDSSCFPLLSKIHECSALNLREAQLELQTSHADISQKAAKLEKLGLIKAETDPDDQRSRILTLTPEGETLVNKARPLWQAIDRTIAKLMHPHEEAFFCVLQSLEQKAKSGELVESYKEENAIAPPTQEIIDYSPEYKKDFERLNREWLNKHFKIEKIDQEMFASPEEKIIKPGGFILFSKCGDDITGTCTLLKNGESFELCKMGVDPRYRGLGIAKLLIEEALKKAKKAGAKSVYLLTHSKLKSAAPLYKKQGFKTVPLKPEDTKKYSTRVDVRMEYLF